MKSFIVFYNDVFDNIDNTFTLVWKKDKKYKIIGECKDNNNKEIIYCLDEFNKTRGIEKDIKNMFYTF